MTRIRKAELKMGSKRAEQKAQQVSSRNQITSITRNGRHFITEKLYSPGLRWRRRRLNLPKQIYCRVPTLCLSFCCVFFHKVTGYISIYLADFLPVRTHTYPRNPQNIRQSARSWDEKKGAKNQEELLLLDSGIFMSIRPSDGPTEGRVLISGPSQYSFRMRWEGQNFLYKH